VALNVELLKQSFEEIKPVAAQVVDRFYQVLFARHPEAAGMFDEKRMPQQKAALIASLVTIFDKLERTDELKNYLQKMGDRHRGYGVEHHHYDWVAESLIDTLKYFFDTTWTAELEDSWLAALGMIAETMRGVPAARPEAVADPIEGIKSRIDDAIRQLMRTALTRAESDEALRQLALAQAERMVKQALDEQLDLLKGKFEVKKAA
jgi:hemoglobin-like flavoprotein